MLKILIPDVVLTCSCGDKVSAVPKTVSNVKTGLGKDSTGNSWKVEDVIAPDGWRVEDGSATCPKCETKAGRTLVRAATAQTPEPRTPARPVTSDRPAPARVAARRSRATPEPASQNRHILPTAPVLKVDRHVAAQPGVTSFRTPPRPDTIVKHKTQAPSRRSPTTPQPKNSRPTAAPQPLFLTQTPTPTPRAAEIPMRDQRVQTAPTTKKIGPQQIVSSKVAPPAGVLMTTNAAQTVIQASSSRVLVAAPPAGVSVTTGASIAVNPSVLGPQPVVSSAIVRPSVTPTTFVGVPPRVVK